MVEEAREVTMEEDLREQENVFQMLEGRTVSSTRYALQVPPHLLSPGSWHMAVSQKTYLLIAY